MRTTLRWWTAAAVALASTTAFAADEPPMALARDGFFYVGGKPTKNGDRTTITGQMFVEYRIPAKQTQPSRVSATRPGRPMDG